MLLNWEAVVPDMYEKEKDRGRIIGIAQVADVLGGVIASVAVEPVFTKYGWSAMATIFGCIGAIVMLLTVFAKTRSMRRSRRSRCSNPFARPSAAAAFSFASAACSLSKRHACC